MAANHARADLLHGLVHAGALIGAPVLLARYEGRAHVDGTARPRLQFRREHARGAAAIPLQAALESVAFILGAVEGKLAVRQPFVGGDFRGRRHFFRNGRGHVLGEVHHVVSRQFCDFFRGP